MNHYFDQINFAAWPRFNNLYDIHIEHFKTHDPATLKQIEEKLGKEVFFRKVISFLIGLHFCTKFSQDNQMINYKITKVIKLIIELVKKLSEISGGSGTRTKNFYCIDKLDFIYSRLKSANAINEQDKYLLEQVRIFLLRPLTKRLKKL